MQKINNFIPVHPQAKLCFRRDEHQHKDLPSFRLKDLIFLSKEKPSTTSFTNEKLNLIGGDAPPALREIDGSPKPIDPNKILSLDPSIFKPANRSLPKARIKVLSNIELDIRAAAYCENPNENVILGLKQRTTNLRDQLQFAVLFKIISFKICLIAYAKMGLTIKKETTSTQSGSYTNRKN